MSAQAIIVALTRALLADAIDVEAEQVSLTTLTLTEHIAGL